MRLLTIEVIKIFHGFYIYQYDHKLYWISLQSNPGDMLFQGEVAKTYDVKSQVPYKGVHTKIKKQ